MTSTTLASADLSVDDLVFLYLAQDGTFNTTDGNDRDYGSQTAPNNAGNWQINRVVTWLGDLVTLECALPPAFLGIPPNALGYHRLVVTKFVVADVLSLTAGASIQAKPFSSLVPSNTGGGVLPILANNILLGAGARISADAAGFPGGVPMNGGGCTDCAYCSVLEYLCPDSANGGMKGASVAPYSEDASVRLYCRGALANGGGGGNTHNAPGGGGANVCNDVAQHSWTGDGVCISINR